MALAFQASNYSANEQLQNLSYVQQAVGSQQDFAAAARNQHTAMPGGFGADDAEQAQLCYFIRLKESVLPLLV